MDISAIIQLLAGQYPWALGLLAFLGSLVVIGQVVVPLTPTQKDDAAWAKLLAMPVVGQVLQALVAFAPIQKK